MRFSTVAATAVLVGFAAALPNNIVYETEVVTITSCGPEKPDCPYATATPEPHPKDPEYPVCPGHPDCPVEEPKEPSTTPCTTDLPIYTPPPHYPNNTHTYTHEPIYTSCSDGAYDCPGKPEHTISPEEPHSPEPETTISPQPHYPEPGHPQPPYSPSGVPYPPVNTSSPVVPSYPPESEGAAGKIGVSIFAVAAAALVALLL